MPIQILRGLGATALVAALLVGVLSASSSAPGATEDEQAPAKRPGVAELALVPAALDVQPDGSARAAITVRLPEVFHMNSSSLATKT